ncbi:MAG: Zn-ribbon containing protein [Candidatus Aenigmatarchaeota archaeon]
MHKCVRCGSIYQDNDASILNGCNCGSIFFLYIKTEGEEMAVEQLKRELEERNTTLENEINKKIEEKISQRKIERDKIVKKRSKFRRSVFGIETVRIKKDGVYEINIDALMKKMPLIVLEKGRVYLIHLPSVFEAEERES